MKFTHLHVHSHYSLLDGLPQIEDLVDCAIERGFEAIALTDHGVMYGAIEFYNYAKNKGIKPIIGLECYVAIRGLTDKQSRIDDDYYHMTLLAETYEGYRNLMKLTSIAHLDGFYYKPRIDKQVLKQYAKGIIGLSGCPRGEIYRALRAKNKEHAKEIALEYIDIFGKDNFFIEIQRTDKLYDGKHSDFGIQNERIITDLAELAQDCGLGLVATSDVHYLSESDAEAQDVLVCIGTGKTVDDEKRMNMMSNNLSLRSIEEMTQLFADYPEAIENTGKIAERCVLDIPINQRYFPVFPTPDNKTPEDYLTEITFERAKKFYAETNGQKDPEGVIPESIVERINYELNIINNKGFATYFLVLSDICITAKQMNIITNTRGSAAGSIVGYVTGITNIDPLYYQLPFERFLTMHRPTPPDIDLDIADKRRDDIIAYITDKYGKEKVAQIITFGTMQARAAVRDVGRALGVAYSKCDRIAKMIPLGKQGFAMTIQKAMDMTPELADIYAKDEETKQIIDIAQAAEGGARHASVHAAGVVITPTDITDYCPIQREPEGDKVITQYDMYSLDSNANIEAIGLVKIDLLGIRNLSILEEALNIVEARHGITIDINNLPQPDKKTFEMLASGLTFGVFQLGGSGMTRYLKELRPKNIFDINVMIALYRPGPMQSIPLYIERSHNPSLVSYLDPLLENILKRNYGIIVYQDDLLAIAHDIAGYSWEEVDKFRKAVGKKIPEVMAQQKEKFIKGCIEYSKFSPAKAAEIWAWIEPFAAYGFNKAHAASYGMVSYQTAYMKANYTVEFMAAVMTAECGDPVKIYEAVEECKKMGINVLPPDVDESLSDFTVIDEHNIRFGLTAIKNLGSDVVSRIIQERKSGGRFKNLKDFILRLQTKNLNKRSWEAMAKCGALDRFGERNTLLFNTDHVLEFARDQFKSKQAGQESLFGTADFGSSDIQLKQASPASQDEMLIWEKELLGLYVSSHPLENYKKVLTNLFKIGSLKEEMLGAHIEVGGIISKLKKSVTKKGQPMLFITIEDQTGSLEAIVFPKTLEKIRGMIEAEKIVQVSGRLSDKDEEFKLLVEEVKDLPNDMIYEDRVNTIAKQSTIIINLPVQTSTENLKRLKQILEKYPGNTEVILMIGEGEHGQAKTIKTNMFVAFEDDLIFELRSFKEILRVRVQTRNIQPQPAQAQY